MTMSHMRQTIFYNAQNVVNFAGNTKCWQKAIVECIRKTIIAAQIQTE